MSTEVAADETGEVANDTSTSRGPRKQKSSLAATIEWMVVIAVAITSAILMKAYVLAQFQVEGTSMLTTLHEGDRVMVNRLSYRLHDPNRGDVVVLHRLEGTTSERDLIKRVIGLPGESIDIRDCEVYIDGKLLVEPYLDPNVAACTQEGGIGFPYVVPDGMVFVMGDNRPGSGDSRAFGAVDEDNLVGRAFVVIWPKDDWAWL